MKKILSLVAATTFAQEIAYYNKPWAEVMARAKAEHKYVFVDCYTDWCGWCKVMDKETMTDEGIIATMNSKFVAVKIDMEKGEGMKLAAKYHISGFPTFMFFNPDGAYVYQVVGYQKKQEFTKELNNSLDVNKQFKAPGFSPSPDVDFPEFYKLIFAGNGKRQFPDPKTVTAYLDQQKDLFTEVNWGVVSQCALDEKYTAFFYNNIDKYRSLYGANSVMDKLNTLLGSKLQNAMKNKSTEEFNEVLKMVDKYITDDPEEARNYCSIAFYKEVKDWTRLATAMDAYAKKNGYSNTNFINSQSWALYQDCSDKKLLTKAAEWMHGVVTAEPKYAYLDTYAAILYKSGQRKQAEVWANKAIVEGKKKGEATASTEDLLKKIKEGK